MEKLSPQLEEILRERYGKDSIIAVASYRVPWESKTPSVSLIHRIQVFSSSKLLCPLFPCVRYVDGFYMDGAFYVITYACSDKMRQIGENPFPYSDIL